MNEKDYKAIAEIFRKYDKLNQEGKLGLSPKQNKRLLWFLLVRWND